MKPPRNHVLRQAAHRGLALLAFTGLSLLSAHATLNGTFTIVSGDPENTNANGGGAVWTYITPTGVLDDGVAYNLRGMLFAPENSYGSGPFPAVVVNHGRGETAEPDGTNPGYVIQCACISANDSRGDLVHAGPTGSEGVVVIGVNLTHTGHTLKGSFMPVAAEGDPNGANTANVQRIQKVAELLANYPYFNPTTGTVKVDGSRLAIHGHSMGAYATGETLGTSPTNLFVVASHTAGGVNDSRPEATSSAKANAITVPYQMHHGLLEGVQGQTCTRVPYSEDRALRDILVANNGEQNVDLHEYSNICHASYFPDSADTGGQNALNSWGEIELWWNLHGLFTNNTDTTAPTVSVTAPANGATVSGTATAVSATASDNVGVVGVQFKLDGANLGAEDATAPYGITWNTTTASNGSHTLTAVARDAAGNSTTSAGINVTVSNSISITLPPVYSEGGNDGWLLESSPGNNTADKISNPSCGNSNNTGPGALRIGDDAGNRQFRSIVSFNVTGLPAGAVIDSATLTLRRSTGSGSVSGFGTSFNAAIKSGGGFAENPSLQWGATTNDFANGSGASPTIPAAVSGLTVPAVSGQTTGTLISSAVALLGNGRFQFRIDFPTKTVNAGSPDYVGFYSGDNTTVANRPVLSITYHLP